MNSEKISFASIIIQHEGMNAGYSERKNQIKNNTYVSLRIN